MMFQLWFLFLADVPGGKYNDLTHRMIDICFETLFPGN